MKGISNSSVSFTSLSAIKNAPSLLSMAHGPANKKKLFDGYFDSLGIFIASLSLFLVFFYKYGYCCWYQKYEANFVGFS